MNSFRNIAKWFILAGLLRTAASGAPLPTAAQLGPATALMANPRAVSNSALVNTAKGADSYAVTADQVSYTLLRHLVDNGVGLVRLVTNPKPLLVDDVNARAAAIAQVLYVVDTIRSAGLRVIVDLHNWPPGDPALQSAAMINDMGQRTRFSRALLEMAGQLQRRPEGSVGLELLNEPACKYMTNIQWPEFQAHLYRSLRSKAAVLPLVLKGCNDGISDLISLDVKGYREDPNVIFSFHFYEPFIFTHQATYYRHTAFHNVPFPAKLDNLPSAKAASLQSYFAMPFAQVDPASVAELRTYLLADRNSDWYARDIKRIGAWADSQGIARQRVFLGEFGMTLRAGPDAQKIWPDILQWLQMVSQTSQREGFSYSLWPPVRSGNAYIDPETNFLRREVVLAAGWRQ